MMKKLLLILTIFLCINGLAANALHISSINDQNAIDFVSFNQNPQDNLPNINPNEAVNNMQDFKTFKDTYLKIIENLSFRNTLWEQSTNFMKFKDKDELVTLWGEGIKNKNGTLLYLISNENIKSQLKNLFRTNTSWYLDNNQNNIKSFSISKGKKISKNLYYYDILYKTTHVEGYNQTLKQHIAIESDGKYFKICEFSNLEPQK